MDFNYVGLPDGKGTEEFNKVFRALVQYVETKVRLSAKLRKSAHRGLDMLFTSVSAQLNERADAEAKKAHAEASAKVRAKKASKAAAKDDKKSKATKPKPEESNEEKAPEKEKSKASPKKKAPKKAKKKSKKKK